MRTGALAVVALLWGAASPAQELTRVAAGTRVRVLTSQRARPLVGTLVRSTPDSVVVDATVIARGSVRRLEVSAGRKSHWLTGAGIGLLVGAGVGAIAASGSDGCGNIGPLDASCTLAIAGVGGAIGTPLGALVGAMVRTDRWRVVPLGHVGFRVETPSYGSFKIAVVLSR